MFTNKFNLQTISICFAYSQLSRLFSLSYRPNNLCINNFHASKEQKGENMKKGLPLFLIIFITVCCIAGLLINKVNSQSEKVKLSQSKETIVVKKLADQPVKIVQIQTEKIKSDLRESFTKSDTWFKGLKIEIENVSEKSISYLSLDLVFRRPKHIVSKTEKDSLPFAEIIEYGNKGNLAEVQIPPKKIVTVSLSDVGYEALHSSLLSLGYPENFEGVEIEVKEIFFTDNSSWYRGVWSKKKAQIIFFLTGLMQVETVYLQICRQTVYLAVKTH